jgi:hypothetical protein
MPDLGTHFNNVSTSSIWESSGAGFQPVGFGVGKIDLALPNPHRLEAYTTTSSTAGGEANR